jgi:predicted dehydrogenase
VFNDWHSMLEDREGWDGLVIATHPDGTPEILTEAIERGTPTLVEKPVAWSSTQLETLCSRPHERVIVGYNRRFYRTVKEARAEVQNGPPLVAHLVMPESIVPPEQPDPGFEHVRRFFETSCHGMDLLRFVFGDVNVVGVQRLHTPLGGLAGLGALLTTARGDIVHFTGNWGTPANWALSLHRRGRRLDLLPFESASVYEGMEVQEPSDEYPIRRFKPRLAAQIFLDKIDRIEKPGFVAQAGAFLALIEERELPAEVATLDDARAALILCETLAGIEYSGLNAGGAHSPLSLR